MPLGKDHFKARKVPEELDYVVIGSGVGGLYAAAMLSKLGHRVLVLEQHYVAGGCMHAFEEKGYEFDTGVHYVGAVSKFGALLDLVTPADARVRFSPLGTEDDGFTYDEVYLGSRPCHRFRRGRQAWLDDLVRRFPSEEEALKRCVGARPCMRHRRVTAAAKPP